MMMLLSRLFVLVSDVLTFGLMLMVMKKLHILKTQVTKLSVLLKKLVLPLQPYNLVILSSCHLLTVVGNVMLAVLVLTGRVIATLAIQTGLLVSNHNMFASTMLTGL